MKNLNTNIIPRDPGSPKLRMVMEPKYYALVSISTLGFQNIPKTIILTVFPAKTIILLRIFKEQIQKLFLQSWTSWE